MLGPISAKKLANQGVRRTRAIPVALRLPKVIQRPCCHPIHDHIAKIRVAFFSSESPFAKAIPTKRSCHSCRNSGSCEQSPSKAANVKSSHSEQCFRGIAPQCWPAACIAEEYSGFGGDLRAGWLGGDDFAAWRCRGLSEQKFD